MVAPALVQRLAQALAGLKYGAVQLVVHEGHVVRIERIERMRLTGMPEAEDTARPTDRTPGGTRADDREV